MAKRKKGEKRVHETGATGRGSLLNAVTSKHAASKGKPKIEKLKDPAEWSALHLPTVTKSSILRIWYMYLENEANVVVEGR